MIQGKTIDKMARFQNNINGDDWMRLWISVGGDADIGRHMWNKFHGYDHQILNSWTYADGKNRRIITKMVNKYWAERGYTK